MLGLICDQLQHQRNCKHKQNIQKFLLNIFLQLNGRILSFPQICGLSHVLISSFIYFAFIYDLLQTCIGRADKEREKKIKILSVSANAWKQDMVNLQTLDDFFSPHFIKNNYVTQYILSTYFINLLVIIVGRNCTPCNPNINQHK